MNTCFVLVALWGTALSQWGELPVPSSLPPESAPSAKERSLALDQMQGAIELWLKERKEHSGDVEALRRLRQEREVLEEPAAEVPVLGAKRRGRYGRIIQVKPAPKPKSSTSAVEQELAEAEARAEQARELRERDPAAYEKQRTEQERIERGDEAFEEAVLKRFEQRRAQIEADARRMQAEVEAARRREELLQAKKLGGTLDAEGNFVDADLEKEP